MSNITQSASDRQSVTDSANAWLQSDEYKSEQEEKRKENIKIYHDRIYEMIVEWCNVTDINDESALNNELKIGISYEIIDQDVLNEWETELTQNGYTMIKDNHFLTISQ